MAKETGEGTKVKHIVKSGGGGGGAVYGLGFIGALIYFLQTSTSFWDGVLGVLKAIVWPAFIIYELLKFFKL